MSGTEKKNKGKRNVKWKVFSRKRDYYKDSEKETTVERKVKTQEIEEDNYSF
jgi:hypothetical protein